MRTLPQGLSKDQVDACRYAVAWWIQIKEAQGQRQPSSADADHSSLLQRLLSGKEPLQHPPPRAFSYPNYELVDTGRYIAYDVSELPAESGYLKDKDYKILCIDQSIQWRIVEKRGPKEWVVCYRENGEKYLVRWAEKCQEIVHIDRGKESTAESVGGWLITRLEE